MISILILVAVCLSIWIAELRHRLGVYSRDATYWRALAEERREKCEQLSDLIRKGKPNG